MTKTTITLDDRPISLSDIANLAKPDAHVQLNNSDSYRNRIDQGSQFLDTLLTDEGLVYGVTTGYGDSCDVGVAEHLVEELSRQLYTFHGCGTGEMLTPAQGKMVLAVRLVSLAKGMSGVRYRLLAQLATLINHNIIPVIPSEGSVGASGDLTPLSYVAACLCGERQVYYNGNIVPTAEAFAEAGIEPITLRPKEGLAVMNGTAVMTALAVEAYQRAEYLAALSCRITALASIGLGANPNHFDETLFAVKPHQGQQQAASRIRNDIRGNLFFSGRLQERYSIRCAPHVIGVLMDALPFFKQTLENEINSANDNPIIDTDRQRILHGGHFYGGHVAFVMDSLKNTVANLADLLDRQLALLVDAKFNHGLPRNLSGATTVAAASHGLKAVQIAASAWTAEALKQTLPASVFSRSTESHNQDKVSMGTIAARDALRVLQLSEQVAAVTLMAGVQALRLRQQQGQLTLAELSTSVQQTFTEVEAYFPLLTEDRALDSTIVTVTQAITQGQFSLYGDYDE